MPQYKYINLDSGWYDAFTLDGGKEGSLSLTHKDGLGVTESTSTADGCTARICFQTAD